VIATRSPYRITLGGGGTDRPDFYEKHGGFVISMAIDKYIYLSLKPDSLEKEIKVRYLNTEVVDNLDDLKHDRAREALRLHNLSESIEVNSCGDVPGQTGLGSSGSYLVALLNAIRHHKKNYCSTQELAEEACGIEIDTLGLPVGKQDQYIAAFGGLKVLDINTTGNVKVKPLNLDAKNLSLLTNNLHIYFLKKKRNASNILAKQHCSLKGNEERLLKIKEMGYCTLDILQSGNFDEYGLLLDEYWNLKKQFSSDMSFDLADKIYSELKNRFGVLGGKIIGAGGGGFLMVYANKNHVEIEKFMKQNSITRLNYKPDHEGSKILF
jgi:D-glycero-alpha-D-manno-heptose-7-phosphate kinase|tara:strand:+ start:1875 stop:2846 length:972 start_codon:yes stop_codon:yes gene_type:complete